jgi:hypothetical protein
MIIGKGHRSTDRKLAPVPLGRPPLWSSGQSSWLRIQRSWFDSRPYQIFWEVVGLERGPLSLVSTIEELSGRKSSGSGLVNRDYGRRGSAALPRYTLLSAKVGANFSYKRLSLGWHTFFSDLSYGVKFSFSAIWSITHFHMTWSWTESRPPRWWTGD